MKLTTIALGLSLLSVNAFANDYQSQVDVDFLKVDSYNTFSIKGTHYFDAVSTKDTAWAEAAFMGRKTNVNASYINYDGDAFGINLGGEYFADDFYGALELNFVDVDNGDSDTNFSGQVGYFFAENWLVALTGQSEDFSDNLGIRTKYVAVLGDDQFVNFEANYSDASEDVTVMADYYWTAQSSIGIAASSADGYEFGIKAQHFFKPSIAVRVMYEALEGDDAITIGLTGRF